VHDRFIGLQQNRQYYVPCRRALYETFLRQIIYQPIVEGMSGFGCARGFGKLMAGQGTLAFVIERVGGGQLISARLWIGRPVIPARNVHFGTP